MLKKTSKKKLYKSGRNSKYIMSLRKRLGGLRDRIRERADGARERIDLYREKISNKAREWRREIYSLFGRELTEESITYQVEMSNKEKRLWKLLCSGNIGGVNPYGEIIEEELGIELPKLSVDSSNKSKEHQPSSDLSKEEMLMWGVNPYFSRGNLREE